MMASFDYNYENLFRFSFQIPVGGTRNNNSSNYLTKTKFSNYSGRAIIKMAYYFTPFAVHLCKIYIHLRQQLKLYGKYTFISTSMNFINANELSITLFAYVLTFNSING